MGLFDRLKQTIAHVKDTAASVQNLQADAASARAEWGDGGTARRGWSSGPGVRTAVGSVGPAPVMSGTVRPGPPTARADAVTDSELSRLQATTDELRSLLATGTSGTVTVHSVRDTGERLARHWIVQLVVVLRPDGGSGERLVTVRLPVCGSNAGAYESQVSRPVRFDPADPSRMAFVWQGTPRSDRHRGHVKVSGWHGQRIDLVGLLPGRALVDHVTAMLAPGEVSNSVQADLHVQLRTPGGLGPSVVCGHFLDWKPVKLLEPGMDVPVAVDPVTGGLEDVVVAALTEELRPRFGELSAADQLFVEPLRDVADQARAARDIARDVTSAEFWRAEGLPEDGGFAPGDPILAPANGVSFGQWVAVTAGLMANRVPPAEYDSYAQRHGVPTGAWAEGERQWRRRQIGHPMMAEKFGRALERARKG